MRLEYIDKYWEIDWWMRSDPEWLDQDGSSNDI